ncbi:MAG TPA: zinc-dependent metalloprotease [Actinomycetes bacterium]|nr:zinc-dependent metalloprotease [Actinomycetes bacterium]
MSNGAIDWTLARTVAHRVGGKGPTIGREGAQQAVEELRVGAETAVHVVHDITGLDAGTANSSVRVVDRSRWVDANAAAFATVLEPLTRRMGRDGTGATGAIGSRVAGAEIGAALGFLSARVLGQYELFTAPGSEPQLLLVAPNVVDVEQRLGVRPSDFRLWVCLHEETHRVQFTAVEWLGPWLREQIGSTLDDLSLEPREMGRRLRQIVAAVLGALRGVDVVKALEQFMSEEERDVLDRLTAVMSLLEGHADVVMDEVDSGVIPTVDVLRKRMNERRTNPKGTEALVRRLLGMEAKLAQYRDGANFVRAVVGEVGMTGFNRVWESPDALPSREELHAPQKWVARVGAQA